METTPSADTSKNTIVKQVQIIARVEFKSDARKVVYFNRSSNGADIYQTSLFDGRVTSCNCPATKPCYHMTQCEAIEKLRKAHVEANGTLAGFVFAVAKVATPEAIEGDMSVADHLLEEELSRYETELRYEGITDLRMRIQRAGISVTSKSKEPLIQALVQHRRETLIVPQMSAQCPQDAPDVCLFCKEHPATQDGYCSPQCAEDAQAAIEEADARMEEATAGLVPVVDVLQDEEALAEPVQPTRAQVVVSIRQGLRILTDLDDDHASEPNGMGFNGTDTEFGHDLATRHTLTEKQLLAAGKMLQKYNRTQLGGIIPPMAVIEKALNGVSTANQRNNAALNGNRDFSILR